MYNLTNEFQHSEPLYFVPIYGASSEYASLEKRKKEKERNTAVKWSLVRTSE